MKIKSSPDYPLVLVHGMFGWGDNEGINNVIPYWGATTGSLKTYLNEKGCECYEASVGPVSSAWDQACELYAQLTGTTVDYGKVHSENSCHKQFGREYEKPLFEGWGAEKKIHLIGHSFGGNASRMLVHLLAFGAPEEVEASGEAVSPLFLGGKGDWVFSLTALCSPLNGTTAHDTAEKLGLIPWLRKLCFNYTGTFGRSRLNGNFVDFHLEQYGLTDTPGQKDAIDKKLAIENVEKGKDNIEYDMSPEGAQKINSRVKTASEVYYFSYPFNSVKAYKNGKLFLPSHAKFLFLTMTSGLMIKNTRSSAEEEASDGESIEGMLNDGLVDVESASFPKSEPHCNYIDNEKAAKGIWNVMPITTGDHGTAIGLFESKKNTHEFFDKVIGILTKIEVENETVTA